MLFGIILTYKITSQCGRWKASWVNPAVILSMFFNVPYSILEKNQRSQLKKPHYDYRKKITKNFAKDSRSLGESDILDNKHLFGLKLLKR